MGVVEARLTLSPRREVVCRKVAHACGSHISNVILHQERDVRVSVSSDETCPPCIEIGRCHF